MHLSWDDLQTVEALVRAGSVVGAARELGLRHTTVSRRVDALEQTLDAALFVRGTRLRPTPLATAIAGRAATMREAAVALEEELAIAERRRRDEVVITTNDVLAALLFRALRALQGPRVTVRLSDDEAELSPGVVDFALRPGAQPRGALRGRRLGVLRLGVYRARQGALDQWVLPSAELRRRSSMRWWGNVPADADAGVTCTNYLSMRDACLAGLGRAALPAFLAEGLTRERELEGVTPVWLLTPPIRNATQELRRFGDALFRELRGARDAWVE